MQILLKLTMAIVDIVRIRVLLVTVILFLILMTLLLELRPRVIKPEVLVFPSIWVSISASGLYNSMDYIISGDELVVGRTHVIVVGSILLHVSLSSFELVWR